MGRERSNSSFSRSGPWILSVSGVDSQGNWGYVYTWINVGLKVGIETDSPNYLLGDPITVFATPAYPDGTIASTGQFTAQIWSGSTLLGTTSLTYDPIQGGWTGTYQTKASSPTGFYKIIVNGTDGQGNAGSFATIVRVAPLSLTVTPNLPLSEFSVNGGTEPSFSAKITYPNGTALTVGNVEAYIYLDQGASALTEVAHWILTYHPNIGAFAGYPTGGFAAYPGLTGQGALSTVIGNYEIVIDAFDASGNFGEQIAPFTILGTSHAPISITSDRGFTAANGVISGDGTSSNPYYIAGWNTSSISVSGNIAASYIIWNNWVQGASGNGITQNTPNNEGTAVLFNTVIGSSGNGIYVNNVPAAGLLYNEASNNTKNGILLGNDSQAFNGIMERNVAENNGMNGIEVQGSMGPGILSNIAESNALNGILSLNSVNSTIESNTALGNGNAGISVGGSAYGDQLLVTSNDVESNGVGISVDGGNQVPNPDPTMDSIVYASNNTVLSNNVGLNLQNNGVALFEANEVGYGTTGIVSLNSVPLIINNTVAGNSGTGINVTGSISGGPACAVQFSTGALLYSSCITGNVVDLNGATTSSPTGDGIVLQNVNGSYVDSNLAENNVLNGILLGKVTDSVVSNTIVQGNTQDGILLQGSTLNSFNVVLVTQNGGSGVADLSGGNNLLQGVEASYNSMNGFYLASGTTGDTLYANSAIGNGAGCSSTTSCTKAAGIYVNQGSTNVIQNNLLLQNNATDSATGFGVILDSNSTFNTVSQNNFTSNQIGVGLFSSNSNIVANNVISGSKYGIEYVDSGSNSVGDNVYSQNTQNAYPTLPTITFTSPASNSVENGAVSVTWTVGGQAITNTTLVIDGQTISCACTTSYSWNTKGLADGIHIVSVTVVNSGGFSAEATLLVSTDNVALAKNVTATATTTMTTTTTNTATVTSTTQTTQTSQVLATSTQLVQSTLVTTATALTTLTSTSTATSTNNAYLAIGIVGIIIAIVAAAFAALTLRRKK